MSAATPTLANRKAAYEAVEKHFNNLVSLLSAEVVSLHDFGQALVAAEFMSHSALKDTMDCNVTKDKAFKLSFIVNTQVQHYPEKFFEAYLAILGEFPPLCSLQETVRREYDSCLPVPSDGDVTTELGGRYLPTKSAQSEALSLAASDRKQLSTKKEFTCPCGKCSLRHFLDGNCPEKGPGFPCLNKSNLSRSEQRLLIQTLIDDSNGIKIKFSRLEKSTKMWLKRNSRCSPDELKDDLKVTTCILNDASDFDSIIHILKNNNFWSWFSFDYLKTIILLCSPDGSEGLEAFPEFNEYEKRFKFFCKRSVFECPNLIANYEPLYQDPVFLKLADEEFKNPSLIHLRESFENALAKVIQVEPRDLILLTYMDGCTQLIYSLPRAVAKKAFPLSQVQKEMLMKMGVLECYLFPHDAVDEAHTESKAVEEADLPDIKILKQMEMQLRTLNKLTDDNLVMQLQAWKEHDQERPLRLLVCGLGGIGKSTLVNCLLQANWAKEGAYGTTSIVNKYERTTKRGIKLCIFDTPGFGDVDHSDESIIDEAIKKTEGKVDLVLYCLSLGSPSPRLVGADANTIKIVTRIFKSEIWKKAVIGLTCANLLAEKCTAECYKAVIEEMKCRLQDELRKNKVSEEMISQLPIMTAGHTNPILKYEEDTAWNDRLFLEVLRQVDPSKIPVILQTRWNWSDILVTVEKNELRGASFGYGVGGSLALTVVGGAVGILAGAVMDAGIWLKDDVHEVRVTKRRQE